MKRCDPVWPGGKAPAALRLDLLRHVTDIHLVKPHHEQLARKNRDLADQLKRALESTGLNISEAFGHPGARRRSHLQITFGSAREVEAALLLAGAWGEVGDVAEALAEVRRLSARLDRLRNAVAGGHP